MPEEGVTYMPHAEILTFEEIDRFVRVAVALGVTKVRVTGGEPLVRKGLPVLIRMLSAMPGIAESIRIKTGRPLRTRGSPPVTLTFVTPSATATRTKRSISSKVRISACGIYVTPSSGMQ